MPVCVRESAMGASRPGERLGVVGRCVARGACEWRSAPASLPHHGHIPRRCHSPGRRAARAYFVAARSVRAACRAVYCERRPRHWTGCAACAAHVPHTVGQRARVRRRQPSRLLRSSVQVFTKLNDSILDLVGCAAHLGTPAEQTKQAKAKVLLERLEARRSEGLYHAGEQLLLPPRLREQVPTPPLPTAAREWPMPTPPPRRSSAHHTVRRPPLLAPRPLMRTRLFSPHVGRMCAVCACS